MPSDSTISRRKALVRMGAIAAVAYTTPVLLTITSAHAKDGASSGSSNGGSSNGGSATSGSSTSGSATSGSATSGSSNRKKKKKKV